MAKLSPKQEKFCIEYLKDFNGAQAAIRAGYSSKTAREQAARLLTKVIVSERIASERKKDAENSGITRQMVLEGYKKLAFFDTRKFYNKDGSLKPVPDLDEESAFALAGFDVNEVGELLKVSKIKISDRKAALDSIAKMLGYNAPVKTDVTLSG